MPVNFNLLDSLNGLSSVLGADKTSKSDLSKMSDSELSAFGLDVVEDAIDVFEKSVDKTDKSDKSKEAEEKQDAQKELQEQIEALQETIKLLNQQIASMPDGQDKTAMQEELSGLEEQLDDLISKIGGNNSSASNNNSNAANNVSAQPSSDMDQYLENYKQAQLSDLNNKAMASRASSMPSGGSSVGGANSVGGASSSASTGASNDISANSVMAKAKDSNQSWGDYWKSMGYDEAAGKKLASAGKNVGGARGTVGYCATGVAQSFNSVYGTSLHGNGCDWDENMRTQSKNFKEIDTSKMSKAELKQMVQNLPAGAVVSWENFSGSGVSSAFSKYGHVTIADGNGGEYSDHYSSNIYTHYIDSNNFTNDKCAIFIPV